MEEEEEGEKHGEGERERERGKKTGTERAKNSVSKWRDSLLLRL